MLDKIILGWYKSMGLVCGWYTKRNDLIAGLLFPALVAFIALWLVVTVTVALVILVGTMVCLPFRGINGLGELGKEFTGVVDEFWGVLMAILNGEPEGELEETTEEPIGGLVEELLDPDRKLVELDNEIEEHLDEYLDDNLDDSQES